MKKITERINEILNKNGRAVVAIDGRCGSGKTTLANNLAHIFNADVIHMDDFFLREEQRSRLRLEMPGENVDHERFYEEVIVPLMRMESFSYRPYSCATKSYSDEIFIDGRGIVIIEGSYSCHKELISCYDLKIFCDIDKDEQIRRLTEREGERVAMFKEKWIPLEEAYFKRYNVREKCDIIKNGD